MPTAPQEEDANQDKSETHTWKYIHSNPRKGRAMPEKDPTTYSLLTYLWVVGISVWGGVVSFYSKVKAGDLHPFSVTHLVGEIVTAGFVGVVTFWLCELAEFPGLLSGALIAISGHMGSKTITLLEDWAQRRFAP